MDKTEKNYEQILKDFDDSIRQIIQDKCLYAVLDVAYQHGYSEGYLDALKEGDVKLKELTGRDSASSDYASLMDKFLDAADDTEHGNKPLASCMGDLFNYFTEHPLEDKNEDA
jgi:predicted helicase